MNLFIFFVLPLATILLSIVLQKILRSPILVAITAFAIYLIVAFVAFLGTLAEAIIAVIIYTLIAYITAYIVMIMCRFRRRLWNNNVNINQVYERQIEPKCCSCEDSDEENLNIEEPIIENQKNQRPVALGNNIVNKRRIYRRW